MVMEYCRWTLCLSAWKKIGAGHFMELKLPAWKSSKKKDISESLLAWHSRWVACPTSCPNSLFVWGIFRTCHRKVTLSVFSQHRRVFKLSHQIEWVVTKKQMFGLGDCIGHFIFCKSAVYLQCGLNGNITFLIGYLL